MHAILLSSSCDMDTVGEARKNLKLKTWWPKKCCHNIKGQQYNMNISAVAPKHRVIYYVIRTKKVGKEREREIDWKRSQSYDKLAWEQKEIFRHCCRTFFYHYLDSHSQLSSYLLMIEFFLHTTPEVVSLLHSCDLHPCVAWNLLVLVWWKIPGKEIYRHCT